jgi:general secretion pathway protein I
MRSSNDKQAARKMRRSVGFTLLEAIVALVLIGGAGMALFSWINSSIVSLRRVEDANARNEAASNIIEYMQAVNPMLTPDGKADFGAYQIKWKSDQQVDTVDGVSNPQGTSLFQLGLYQTRIEAIKADDPHWFDLKLTLVGYKKVREKAHLLN